MVFRKDTTAMTDHSHDEITPKRQSVRDAGATLLAAGGLAAAFGAASCCALPMLLGSFGLGSAWLIAVAWLAAPYRLMLLGLAVICLGAAGGLLLWRRRSAAVCAVGAGSARAAITAVIVGQLALGVVLTVLGFLYA
jgi:mercuric ion transport protein